MEEKNGKTSIIVLPEKDEKSNSFWNINKLMLPYKLHFFLFIGAMGAVLPFQSAVGITKLGLTASNIAALFAAQQFLFVLFKPAVGYITDYFNGLKATIIGLTVLSAIFSLLMIIIPNSGMPGVKNIQFSNVTDTEDHACKLCIYKENYYVFDALPQHLDVSTLRQVLLCFHNNKETYLPVDCSDRTFSSTNYFNGSFEIVHGTCKSTNNQELGKNISSTDDMTETYNYLFRLSSNNSRKHILCIMPQALQHAEKNSDYFKQYCYTLPHSDYEVLDEFFVASDIKKMNCSNIKDNDAVFHENSDNVALSAENFRTYQFWLYSVCILVACTCDSSLFTISDTACYESVQGVNYGRQRAWGAVSWGVIAPLAGFLNDYTHDYFVAWCLMMFLFGLQLWNLSKMNLVKPDFSQNMFKDLKSLFSSFDFLSFELGIFMNGVFTGIIWFYLTWFVLDIGGTKLEIGLVHSAQCFLGEIPAMMFSDWMIKKLGHFNLVSVAIAAHGIRFFLYSFIYNPWYIIPVEMLHGFTYGLFYPAMTAYGKLNSKPGTEATTQSVLCVTYEALGAGTGCVVSGICFDYYGSHTTFFYASFACAAATLLNVLSTFFIGCRKQELDLAKTDIDSTDRY